MSSSMLRTIIYKQVLMYPRQKPRSPSGLLRTGSACYGVGLQPKPEIAQDDNVEGRDDE